MSKKKALASVSYQAVVVEWVDAQSFDAWDDMENHISQCPIVVSVGFLIHEDEHVVIITQNVDVKNGSASMTTQIPAGMVKEIYHLK